MTASNRPQLADATLRHAVHVEGLKAGQVKKFAPFLREIDRNIREQLTRDDLTTFKRERLEALLMEVDAMLAGVLERFSGQMLSDLREFAPVEAQATAAILSQAGVSVSLPAAEAVIATAFTEPLMAGKGKLLEGFVRDWTRSERQAVTGAIRLGVVQGKTTAEIVRDIRGTKARKFADGLLAVTARNAETIVLTAIAHVAASARASVYGANADILGGEQWDATLDHRTCIRCQGLDRQVFEVGKGPQNPLHPRCRCVRIPVLSDEFAFLSEGEQRASEHGPVEAESYYAWLKRQPPEYQDKVLGPTRAKLLRDGGLSAERFGELMLDRRWQPMTLDEMRNLDPELFSRVFDSKPQAPVLPAVDWDSLDKKGLLAQAERLAERTGLKGILPNGDLSGAREFMRAVDEVNTRFGLSKMQYFGSPGQDSEGRWRRFSPRTLAAFGIRRDSMLVAPRSFEHPSDAAKQSNEKPSAPINFARIKDATLVRRAHEAFPEGKRSWMVERSPRALAIHEMGHRLEGKIPGLTEAGARALASEYAEVLTQYARENEHEMVAESFALYITKPGQHWRIHPELLALFRRHDKGGVK